MSRSRWVAAFAFVGLTASACGMGPGSGQLAQGTDRHLVYAEQFPPRAAWALETDDAYTLSRAGCLETLLEYRSDRSLAGRLATSWERVRPTMWEFRLRDGVKFQDGTTMDADAVAGALTQLLEAETPARSFNSEVVSRVDAADASTVRISTHQPDPLLPYRMASPNTGILAPQAYSGERIDITGTCTGPFTVTEEIPQQSLFLERNEEYWGEQPRLATAEVRFIVDGATRVTQLQTGEVDIAPSVPVSSLPGLEGGENLEVSSIELPRTTAMVLNTSRPPFDDPLVRRAIQRAVDVEAIAEGIYEGAAVPAIGPFAPDQPWAPEGGAPVEADLDEARRLLDRAGVDPSTLTFELITYTDRPELPDVAVAIQDQLRGLGIEVRVRSAEYVSFEPDLLAGEYDAFLLSRSYLSDVGDPAGYLTSDYTCGGGFNVTTYCDGKTDAQVHEASRTEEPDARYRIYADIAEKLQSQAVNVFLVHERGLVGTAARVENFEQHPMGFYALTPQLGVG